MPATGQQGLSGPASLRAVPSPVTCRSRGTCRRGLCPHVLPPRSPSVTSEPLCQSWASLSPSLCHLVCLASGWQPLRCPQMWKKVLDPPPGLGTRLWRPAWGTPAAHPAGTRRALVISQSPGLSTRPARRPVLAPTSAVWVPSTDQGSWGSWGPGGPTTQGGAGEGDRSPAESGHQGLCAAT